MSLLDRSSKFPFHIIFGAVLVFALVGNISPAGGLDPTFGAGGLAFTSVGTSSVGNDLAVQADGKIVVVGYTPWNGAGSDTDYAVVRFNTNGTLDTSFDGDGKVITPFGPTYDIANAVEIQADGKIIAAGSTVATGDDFSLARYNPDGSLDTTFDGDGKVITSIGAGDDDVRAIAIQPDGKIIVAGDAELVANSSNYFALARYNPDGSLDMTFDGDGKVTTFLRNAPNDDKIFEIELQPDGKILAAGWSYAGINFDYDFALARYNSDGSLDTTFDGDGKLTTAVSTTTSPDVAYGIALQPDGKIVAAGNAYAGANNDDCAVLRYNSNGSLDTTFDGDGKVYFSFHVLLEALRDVVIQPDGKIVAAGYKTNFSGSPTSTDLAVVRLNPNGSLDTTFDGDGKVITQPGINTGMGASSVKLLPNGKIVAAGYHTLGATAEFAVARYMGDVNVADFDGDTKTDLSIFRPSNGQWWWQNSGNNSVSALTFGISSDKIAPGDYTGDGKTDVAVWRPSTGEWFILRSEDYSYYSHPFGTNGDIPAPGDFDGDGKTDETVFRPSTGTWYVLRSSGGTTIRQFGANGDVPLPSDFDGDGKADLAIFRTNTSPSSQWWILRSSDSQAFATVFGDPSDKPVPGDYTGDSKTDIAFWRPSNGSWYVLRSEDFSDFAFPFGAGGDIPAPADYDGDGKTDAAVFRPPTGTWYLQRSTAGLHIQKFGVTGDQPVPGALPY